MKGFLDLIAAHEDFVRGRMGGCRAVFRFADLPGVKIAKRALEGIHFIGCNLTGARMAGADLRFASLYCSNLERADLQQADLTRADMRGVSLRGTRLNGACLDEADFRQAELVRMEEEDEFRRHVVGRTTPDATPDEMASVDFSHCSMKGARLNGARLQGANFTDAILEDVDLSGANLLGARFNGAVMTGVMLANTRLDADALAHAVSDPSPAARDKAPDLKARIRAGTAWTRSDGAEGAVPRFDGTDLRVCGREFCGSALAAASFRDCCAIGVDFSGAQLVGTTFDGADLRGANFTGADLRGASFRNCKLAHTRFIQCDLRSLAGAEGRRFAPRFDGSAVALARFGTCRTDSETQHAAHTANAS